MQMVITSNRIIEGVNRMDNILCAEEITEGSGSVPTKYDVEYENVSFSYGDGILAVNDVSCRLPQGSITGIVGPSGGGRSTLVQLRLHFYETGTGTVRIGGGNGAGKTTLLRALAGLCKPKKGVIKYNGKALSARQVRRLCGLVTQDVN